MKKLFALAVVALITAPAGAHSVRTSDGFEVEPTHCVRDGFTGKLNCWYAPVPTRPWESGYYYHHNHHYHRKPLFRPNEHNEHGVPCYFYKDDNWGF